MTSSKNDHVNYDQFAPNIISVPANESCYENSITGQRSCRNFYNYVDDAIVNQEYKIRTSRDKCVRMTSGLPESVCNSFIRDPTCPNVQGTLKESETITSKNVFFSMKT